MNPAGAEVLLRNRAMRWCWIKQLKKSVNASRFTVRKPQSGISGHEFTEFLRVSAVLFSPRTELQYFNLLNNVGDLDGNSRVRQVPVTLRRGN